MIITEQKPLEEILGYLEDYKRIAIIGCGECATVALSGGQKEVEEMALILTQNSKQVIYKEVISVACRVNNIKRAFKRSPKIHDADAILIMACGAGVQAVRQVINTPIYPGLNSLFLANAVKAVEYEQNCITCGNCILGITAGVCPRTHCPKGLLNGPCGGMEDGRCEIDPAMECAWAVINRRLKEIYNKNPIEHIIPPMDYSKKLHPSKYKIDVQAYRDKKRKVRQKGKLKR